MNGREQAVKDNIGLVHACAVRFRGKGIEYDDLYQAGCVGLIKAVDGFDPSLGYRFSTYAVPVIMGEIKRIFRDSGSVKVSRTLRELSLKIGKVSDEFIKINGREPTVSEIAQRLGSSEETVAEAIGANTPPISLTAVDENGQAETDIPVPSHDGKIIEIMSLHTELNKLHPSDRKLIELRFFRHMTQKAAARQLGMTQVQVSRREKKILDCLREKL